MVMYLVLGCLMDALAMIVLTVPIIFPVIKQLGFDPIWFGVIIVMTVELGLIHPPVGMNIFVIKSVVEDAKISTIFYGVLPFIITDIIRLIISEGPRFPELAEFYHREVIARVLPLLRRRLRQAVKSGELRHDALVRFPQLLVAPALVAILWSALFGRFSPLDARAFLRAHIEVLFPESARP